VLTLHRFTAAAADDASVASRATKPVNLSPDGAAGPEGLPHRPVTPVDGIEVIGPRWVL
jgi:hypothetical protein